MVAKIKNFDIPASKKQRDRPEFQLAGQHFTCRAQLSFRKFKSIFLNPDDSVTESMVKIEDFFAVVLLPGDRERFAELLEADDDDDDAEIVTLEQVSQVLQWLVSWYSKNGQGPAT